jgi:hypothetical protein
MARARKATMAGGDNPQIVSRMFTTASNNASRDMIEDEEFWWLENLIPLANGNLGVLPQESTVPIATLATVQLPVYACGFTIGATNYAFTVFGDGIASSSGFITNLTTGATTALGAVFAAGTISATPYNNQGLLIISSSAYYDWGVTTPGMLTNNNNTIQGADITLSNSIPATSDSSDITITNAGIVGGGDGTSGQLKVYYQAVSIATITAGTGYVVGDILTFTGGSPEDNGVPNTADTVQIVVTQVAAGAITGIQLVRQGSYAGPVTGDMVGTILPGGAHFTGGSGISAKFAISWQVIPASVLIVNPGSNYTNGATSTDVFTDINGTGTATILTLATSGVIGGQCIATFAARVWIANNRTVYVTDVDTYNDFGGSGTNFTISDAYLHANITALYAGNNYLYIFGDTSIDAVSNVQVISGLISFSRVNLTTSIGTSEPTSVFGYFRGVVFYHVTGIYLLAGASPERISAKIQGVMRATNFNQGVSGCALTVASELCAVATLNIQDEFYAGTPVAPIQRNVLALYFGGRWLFARVATGASDSIAQLIFSIPGGGGGATYAGASVLYYIGFNGMNPAIYQAFSAVAPRAAWGLRTKLWDAGSPLREKQALEAVVGMFNGAFPAQGLQISVDTELGSVTLPAISLSMGAEPYSLLEQAAQGGASQYLGLTVSVTAGQNVSQISLLGLRALAERDMLQ